MISEKMAKIRLLLLDVDGVLTTGDIIYNDKGEEAKVFNVRDGLGLRLLMKSGIKVGIITGRRSNSLTHRCRNLGIEMVFDGALDKAKALNTVLDETGLALDRIAFMGDDLLDLAVMGRVGLAVAVRDAHESVLEKAHLVTKAKGGRGAVRELCESILKAQGLWAGLLEEFS
jgi:3-deoxy-D-manno-octulosonate 8-phosphate phosphatase (KDO 8-P phosphatase)